MIINLPDLPDWRIKGDDLCWTLQKKGNNAASESGYVWTGVKFYNTLPYAVHGAYELMMRELDEMIEYEDLATKCHSIANKLLKAVTKAVDNGN